MSDDERDVHEARERADAWARMVEDACPNGGLFYGDLTPDVTPSQRDATLARVRAQEP